MKGYQMDRLLEALGQVPVQHRQQLVANFTAIARQMADACAARPPEPAGPPLHESKRIALDHIKAHPHCSARQIAEAAFVEEQTVRRWMQRGGDMRERYGVRHVPKIGYYVDHDAT